MVMRGYIVRIIMIVSLLLLLFSCGKKGAPVLKDQRVQSGESISVSSALYG